VCPRCRLDAATKFLTGGEAGPTLESLAASIGPSPGVLLPETADGATEQPLVDPSLTEMPSFAVRAVGVQLLGELARGGMGVVLKGRDPGLGRDVAVKVLLESNKEKPDLVRRFVEEAQIGGQLQHPGVVPVYELGSFGDGRPYFTMKLVKGKTLAELLAERDTATNDLPRFLGIFEQVCQTMAYAHSRDVIHRDLKPSNVMVGSFGEVQVMDWGLAKVLPKGGVVDDAAAGKAATHATVIATARVLSDSDLSQAGSVMGTPAYMAPEQARGEGEFVDRRADVFALGSILCEVLTGAPAFVGRKQGEIHRKAALGDLGEAMARLEACGAPGELTALARDCLGRESEDRPSHAAAVAERMTAYLAGVQDKLRAAEIARATEQTRAEEEAKRRVLADELAREAQARAVDSQRAAELAEGRAKAERRSRRLTAALAASMLGLVVVSGSAYAWYANQRASRQTRVDLALREAELLRDQASRAGDDLTRWGQARDAARSVERLMADGGNLETRQRVAELMKQVGEGTGAAHADRKLLDDLVDIRSAKADDQSGMATDAAYEVAFREAGYDMAMAPDEVGARFRARPAALAIKLAAAVDDWAAARRDLKFDRAGASRLENVARAADRDPWRNRLRDALDTASKPVRLEALKAAASEAKIEELSAFSLDLLGSALCDAGDPAAAERVLRAAQRLFPGDLWLSYNLGRSLEKLARRQEAIRYYTAAQAIRPEVSHDLAHALDMAGEPDEAIAVFQELARLRLANGRNLVCLAKTLSYRGRSKEAARVLAAAVSAQRLETKKHPDDGLAHFQLARALEQQGQRELAVAEFRVAAKLRPEAGHILACLAAALVAQGQVEEGVRVAHEAVRIDPSDRYAQDALGDVFKTIGKLDEALAAYRSAIRIQPDDHHAYDQLGSVLSMQGKMDEAIPVFREAIRLDRTCANAHGYLGLALQTQGKLDEAIAEFKESVRLKPGDAWCFSTLGQALERKGQWNDAIAVYQEGLMQTPNAWVCDRLCDLLDSQSKLEAAVEMCQGVLRRTPQAQWARMCVGGVRARQGKLDEAIENFQQAIKLNPDDPSPHWELARALTRKGHSARAMEERRTAFGLEPEAATGHNQFAWGLAQPSGRPRNEYDIAVEHARKAVELTPDDANRRNTLALAEYRAGHWNESIAAAEQSIALSNGGGVSDWFFLAMAHWQKGEKDTARTWFDKAVARVNRSPLKNREHLQFWKEAAELLGRPGPEPTGKAVGPPIS
jgi:serine/threonine-protein kinase